LIENNLMVAESDEKDKIIEELTNELKLLEQDMNKELRMKTRKISSQQI
jgi:predicted AlkP superfamily phosphohydrolase/phosphomutase